MTEQRLKHISACVTPSEFEQIQTESIKLCLNKAELIRLAIFQYIKEEVKNGKQ